MNNYKMEDLKIWKEFCKNYRHRDFGEPSYSIERGLTVDEKIEMLNEYSDPKNLFTKCRDLLTKWNNDKVGLVKKDDSFVSSRAFNKWLKNNKGDIPITDDYFNIFGVSIYFDKYVEPTENQLDSEAFINKIFHKFVVIKLLAKEREFYLTEDRKAVKFLKLRKLVDAYRHFSPLMIYDFGYNLDVTEIEGIDETLIDELLGKFEELQQVIDKFDKDFIDIAKVVNWRESL